MPGMDEHYIAEKLGQALSVLVTGTRSLPERVQKAMTILVMFSPEEMPDKWSRETFAELLYRCTDREAVADEGQLAATLDNMAIGDVQDVARMIVELDHHFVRRHDARYAAEQIPLDAEDTLDDQ